MKRPISAILAVGLLFLLGCSNSSDLDRELRFANDVVE